MYNPYYEKCTDAGCVDKLEWDSDMSSLLSWPDTSHGIRADGGDYCLRYRDDKIDDKSCDEEYYYICEFKCPGTRV